MGDERKDDVTRAWLEVVELLTRQIRDSSGGVALVQRDVRDLVRAMRGDGNGEHGALARLAVLEQRVKSVERRCAEWADDRRRLSVERLRGHWRVMAALAGGAGLVASVVIQLIARLIWR